MSKETHHTTAEPASESLRATRRTALRGAGLAGLLVMGSDGVTAGQNPSEANSYQTKSETSEDDEPIPVTWENFLRAQADDYFESHVEIGGFGEFKHYRDIPPIEEQVNQPKAPNHDVLYSWGIFDL